MMKPYKFASVFLIVLFISVLPAAAQQCPASVLLSIARAASACMNMERDTACYGGGSASATFSPQGGALEQPGDRVPVNTLASLSVTSTFDDISLAYLYVQSSLADVEQRSVTMLLVGDAEIINATPYTPELVATASGTLNIRREPAQNSEVIARVGIGEGVVAIGRNIEGGWVRVRVPNSEEFGWVALDVVTTQGDINQLIEVDVDTPFYRPFQIIALSTLEAVFCDGALPSGLLVQTPNPAQFVDFTINGVQVRLAGTFWLQAGGNFRIVALDGQAEVTANGATRFIPAGSQASVALDQNGFLPFGEFSEAEPYTLDDVRALPVMALPLRVTIAEPLTPEQIAAQTAAYFTPTLSVEATPEAVTVSPRCEYEVRGEVALRAGPGRFYEAINNLRSETLIEPVLEYVDPDGGVWWQLPNSNWIAAAGVEQRGECEAIPVTTFVPAPRTNYLSLETCQTSNGPLREGQIVTLEFVPPPWESYNAAIRATQVDPGRITVDTDYLYVYASEPIKLSTDEDRYIRTFSTTWEAAAGTHRIVGARREYIMICELTVPVG
jgi:uncharacterized protein YgiM (DUF1202 family)